MKPYLILLTALALLFLSNCLSQGAKTQDDAETSHVKVSSTPSQLTPGSTESPNPIDLAKINLAQRLGVSVEEIELVNATRTTWPDASLGCPKPGALYVQVLTDGYLILFEVNGAAYEYHTDFGERIVLCENPELPIFPVKPGEVDDGEPWMPN